MLGTVTVTRKLQEFVHLLPCQALILLLLSCVISSVARSTPTAAELFQHIGCWSLVCENQGGLPAVGQLGRAC
jgi:hypothetical protein